MEEDYPALIRLFDDAYAGMDVTYGSREDLAAVIRACPEAQVVAESAGEVVGVILTIRCRYADFTRPRPLEELADPSLLEEHGRDADSLFALDILVHRSHQRRGIGRRMNAAIAAYMARANLRAFIGVSRVPGFAAQALPIDAYVERVRDGHLRDPSLSFNIANGMLPTVPVPAYFPPDVASGGYGVIVIQPNPGFSA